MNQTLRSDAEKAIYTAINAVMPEGAVRKALLGKQFPGRVFLVAAGKAAPKMAEAATSVLSAPITDGVVISKYGHFEEPITGLRCFEAGHPVPDKNSVAAADAVLKMTENLREDDTVLFLLSGGGSALFEKPLIPLEELQDITSQLLACGADIVEINTIRKRLSAVKGGKFAAHCAPAKVEAIILSDILGDPLDMIASGPVSPDSATCDDAQKITEKYRLRLSEDTVALLRVETPKNLDNVNAQVVGSVRELCRAAGEACRSMGYETIFLTDQLNCEAREAGRFLAAILRSHRNDGKKTAFLAGGETVVHLTGKGKGGRNQELALAACEGIHGMQNAAVISVGSDGTDGPTDAAGGYVDGASYDELCKNGIKLHSVLQENDAYHALLAIGGLIVTGPTGTNVNDICIGLLDNMIPSSAGTLVN
jgi:hydroxypyruvate reductase